MAHEGEVLKNYAKVQKGGITALEKALDLTRSGLRYYLDRTELDLKFKQKIADLYGTSVENIWQEAEKDEKKPPTPNIIIKAPINANTPMPENAEELWEFIQMSMASEKNAWIEEALKRLKEKL